MPEDKKTEVEDQEVKQEPKKENSLDKYPEEIRDYIHSLREEAKSRRLSEEKLQKQIDEINKKEQEAKEKKAIEDGELKSLLDEYKQKNETLLKENQGFKSILDKNIESGLENLTDQQKEFAEKLDYFEKIEYVNLMAGQSTNLPPDQKKSTTTAPETEHAALLQKYKETGDDMYLIKAGALEKDLLKAKK